jgi:hypothetical protein
MDQRGYQLFLMELSDAANRSAARVLSAAMQHCDQMGGSVCHLVRGVPCNHHHRAPRAPKIIINPRPIWAILLNARADLSALMLRVNIYKYTDSSRIQIPDRLICFIFNGSRCVYFGGANLFRAFYHDC